MHYKNISPQQTEAILNGTFGIIHSADTGPSPAEFTPKAASPVPATRSAHPADRMSIHSREGRKGLPCRQQAVPGHEVGVSTTVRETSRRGSKGMAGVRGGKGGNAVFGKIVVVVLVVVSVMLKPVRSAGPTGLDPWEVVRATSSWCHRVRQEMFR